ncbi:transcriptional regulator (plasmid) [Burkholderia sp. SFA1]|uniref:LysR substrate-binding domain-containing protein n=1 Tax=unclassified Caballeronia TaxID=2646786 RepID=UPI001F322A67|nr:MULTISPECIES: LysR substrate-binding domain-containing protein [unclassified Caballeronia]MCE4547061.1 LysR substrate-binding domain-containing protein [Caballeronia sp. PC1]MCE4572466.1 LysR substrate-binding domain-containing protein [Caballeronia sp. CLC5]BBQ02167.1 transcriptional regulator [Burkholderia sp. SFA1]
MPQRLPPLNALRLFEAAARHRSFKLAAAELNVTPGAVSHGIGALEKLLGVELFVREPRGLSLSAAGEHYLPYIAEAFSLIAIGTRSLADRRTRRSISVTCAPTLAARWLVPRLADFRARWPDVDVSVDTSRRQAGFPVDGFDIGLRLSRGPVDGASWQRLFGERLVPLCSPAYRARLSGADGSADLSRATLIHVDTASQDWQAWMDGAGIDGLDLRGGLRFDTVQLAFDAAAAGLGVVIGRRPLVDRELTEGTLVEASATRVETQTAYWLCESPHASERADLVAFRNWLIEQAASFAEGEKASD